MINSYRSNGPATAAGSLSTQTMETLGYHFLKASLSRGHDSFQEVMAYKVISCHHVAKQFSIPPRGVLVLSGFIHHETPQAVYS